MPEVKEMERKSRGPVEASDAQMDGTGMRVGVAGRALLQPLSCMCKIMVEEVPPLWGWH